MRRSSMENKKDKKGRYYTLENENKRVITNPEECQCLCCLGGNYEKKLEDLLDKIRLRAGLTGEECKKAGFSDSVKGTYYYHRRLHEDDNYPVSLDITIKEQEDNEDLVFNEVFVVDECFLQPHPCGKQEYRQIEQLIRELINKKILAWKDRKKEVENHVE